MAKEKKSRDETRLGQVRVTFEPTGRGVSVLRGTGVMEAAALAGLSIDTPCGGKGTCGKCRVRFMRAAPSASESEAEVLGEADIEAGWRLACQAKITADTVVAIPETSLFTERLQILTQSNKIIEISSDDLPAEQVICPVPIRPGERNFAIAFDLGTTTLVGELLEVPTGAERAIAAGINPQVSFGDDVVSRIGRACESDSAAAELRDAVRDAIEKLIDKLCEEADVRRDEIRALSFSGNTTMQHLLCGLDVRGLSHLPFKPTRFDAMETSASDLGFAFPDEARAYVMPVIGGFVGGDTVSGILAMRLAEQDGPALMVDIGTNGEIVLAVEGRLYAASAAAGPAFEGARIACGMRAANGAIEKVVMDGELKFSVIGGVEPIGLCGSALVDVAAELLRCGIMGSTGRLVEAEKLPPRACEVCDNLRDRLRKDADGQLELVLSAGLDGSGDVTIKQRDIRELQLAAGALRAGAGILLKQAGLTPADLRRVMIAGGFGSFIRRNNAQRIGLIPAEVPADRVSYVGNVSLHGAKWVLVSASARREAEELAGRTTHVELSADTDFQMAFAEAMIFPEDL